MLVPVPTDEYSQMWQLKSTNAHKCMSMYYKLSRLQTCFGQSRGHPLLKCCCGRANNLFPIHCALIFQKLNFPSKCHFFWQGKLVMQVQRTQNNYLFFLYISWSLLRTDFSRRALGNFFYYTFRFKPQIFFFFQILPFYSSVFRVGHDYHVVHSQQASACVCRMILAFCCQQPVNIVFLEYIDVTQSCDALYVEYGFSFLFVQRLEDAMSKYWFV